VAPSALDELLATEAGIAQRLADADREAEAMLTGARQRAEACERDAAGALARELAGLDERARLAREALVRGIEEEAARVVQRYRNLTDAEIAQLAAASVADATGLEPQGVA
jgi:hypothetical protein